MAHSERHEELAALQALGLLSREESAELSRHLAEGCPTCESLAADFRVAAASLSVEARPQSPNPALRGKILASLPGTAKVSPLTPAISLRERGRGGWWLAAAAALLAAVLLWDDARIRRQREELRSREAQLTGELSKAQ